MSTELATQSVDMSAYQLRRRMLGRLAQAQELEHKFYEACRDTVKVASTRLTDHYSELIQRQIPKWDVQQAEEFARLTSIASENLANWRRSFDDLIRARSDDAQAKLAVNQAGKVKSEASGLFGGAKKGREIEHRQAADHLKKAEQLAEQCARQLKGATQSATAAAERLLEACMANSARLAEAADYPTAKVTRSVLIAAATRAEQLTSAHQQQQQAIHLEMQRDLNALSQLVGNEHGR